MNQESNKVDTSADAVRALVVKHTDLATFFRHTGDAESMEMHDRVSATLSALLARCEHLESEAEKDAANIKRLHELNATFVGIESERDDLRARLERAEHNWKSAEDELAAYKLHAQARVAELEERLHYCNGTSELALKHRDEAEAREKTLREALEKVPPAWIGYADWRESWAALAGSAQPSAPEGGKEHTL
jgi:chromosome segregation ATPase